MHIVSIDDLIKKLTDKHMELKEAVKEANKVQFKNQDTYFPPCRPGRARHGRRCNPHSWSAR